MKNDVRKLTEGAMMVAMTGVVLFINRQSAGMLESLLYWVLSFPILIYTVRYGLQWGCITFTAMMLLSFIISTPQTLFYLFSALIIGVVYGVGVRKKWTNRKLLNWTMLFTFFSYLITMFVLASFFGYNIKDEASAIIEIMSSFQLNGGVSLQNIAMISIVLVFVVSVVTQSLCVHLVAILLLKRLKIEVNPVKSVYDLRLNKGMGVSAIIIALAFVGGSYFTSNETVELCLFVAYACMLILYVAYGTTVILCFMIEYKKQKWAMILALLYLLPPCWILMAALGVWDSFVDIKGKLKRGEIHGSTGKF